MRARKNVHLIEKDILTRSNSIAPVRSSMSGLLSAGNSGDSRRVFSALPIRVLKRHLDTDDAVDETAPTPPMQTSGGGAVCDEHLHGLFRISECRTVSALNQGGTNQI